MPIRVTQVAVEITATVPANIRVTQVAVELTYPSLNPLGVSDVRVENYDTALLLTSQYIYTLGGRIGLEPSYTYAVSREVSFVYSVSSDEMRYSASSSFSAFLSIERSAELIAAGTSAIIFTPGGAIWNGALSVSGAGSTTILGSVVWRSSRLLSSGNGDIHFLASKFFEDNSLLVYGYGDSFFFGGFLLEAAIEPMQGLFRSRFTSGQEYSADLLLNGVGDAVFQALVQTGGLQISGDFYKVFVVDDTDLRYLSMQDIKLVLPQNSRYKSSEVILAKDIVMLSAVRAVDLQPDISDLLYETKLPDEGRLDLISYKMYGTASLWWILATINGIRDPFTLPVSTLLRIPTHDRILREALSSESRRS